MNAFSRLCCFWWRCIATAHRGGAAFGNDWQWLIGIPVVAFLFWLFRDIGSKEIQDFFTPNNAIGAFVTALAAFLITVILRFTVRLLFAPADLFYNERHRAEVAEQTIRDIRTPTIEISLNPVNNGILIIPTEGPAADGTIRPGPTSKWVQFMVKGTTDALLEHCEARLTSIERLNADGSTTLLEPEHIHCKWSMMGDHKQIDIPQLISHHANLFSLYNCRNGLKLEVIPEHITLRNEMQKPGRYRIRVVVTANGARSAEATYMFEWYDFNNVGISRETN